MKKTLYNDMKVSISESPEEIFGIMRKSSAIRKNFPESELPWPFTQEMLTLLRTANPLPQKYYFLECGEKYAFFTMYLNRMDLFTFGKAKFFMNIQTIAFPCSLSTGGYITNDITMMLEYIKTIRGCKLVLNIPEQVKVRGMANGETLPSCVLTIPENIKSTDDYLASMRSAYRRRINLALKRCSDITVKLIHDGSTDVHPLYLQTFERSDYKLECLEKEFFDRVQGDRMLFLRNGKPAGFVLLKKNGSELVFMLCGMDYRYETADLYFLMLFKIVEYAIQNGCRTVDFGQTSETTKLRFGALLNRRYFCAHHTNIFLNLFAMAGKRILEYRYEFPDHKVFSK